VNYIATLTIADKLSIWHFNMLCKKYEVRCLRNNIYQSVIVRDFDHLAELWKTNPRSDNYCKDPIWLLKSLRYILKKQNQYPIGKFNTYEYLFTIYIGMNEQEVIEEVRRNASKVKYY
jgi:hypothetical protein